MDGATGAANKELKQQVVMFALDTHNFGLKIEPIISSSEDNWDVAIYDDSNYGRDKKTGSM
jgi:hypothetical protein